LGSPSGAGGGADPGIAGGSARPGAPARPVLGRCGPRTAARPAADPRPAPATRRSPGPSEGRTARRPAAGRSGCGGRLEARRPRFSRRTARIPPWIGGAQGTFRRVVAESSRIRLTPSRAATR
jgi:hypothetical protein